MRNDARNGITIIVAIVTSALTITLFRLNWKRKVLVYEFLSMTRLLSVQEGISGRIRVLVDEDEVKDVGLVQIKIANVGTEPIRASDFVRPISFSVDEGVRIIEAEVSDRRSPTIDAEIHKDDRKATLLPTLLNARNSLVIKLLIADFNGKISTDARIEGVDLKVRPRLLDRRWALVLWSTLNALYSVGIVAEGFGFTLEETHNDYKK